MLQSHIGRESINVQEKSNDMTCNSKSGNRIEKDVILNKAKQEIIKENTAV